MYFFSIFVGKFFDQFIWSRKQNFQNFCIGCYLRCGGNGKYIIILEGEESGIQEKFKIEGKEREEIGKGDLRDSM